MFLFVEYYCLLSNRAGLEQVEERMNLTPGEDDFDGFWRVQLAGTSSSAAGARPFDSEAPIIGYKDSALPVGAEFTPEILASVFGCVRTASIPLLLPQEGGDGEIDHQSDRRPRQLGELVLRLREVNGDGVMSGVGGDVWCAALLLSTWLLANPEVVRWLSVLELGSGLGLCGIAAGYLARTVTLTDYVDELLENLRYNVNLNREPRITFVSRTGNRPSGSPLTFTRATAGERTKRAHSSASWNMIAAPDGDVDSSTEGVHDSYAESADSRQDDADVSCASIACTHAIRGTENDSFGGGGRGRAKLARMDVCKLDWTTFAGRGEEWKPCRDDVGDGRGDDGSEWWEDAGPGVTPEGAGTNGDGKGVGSRAAMPRCDVVIGSALVYSPHHQCVADVLLRAFSEGGCRAAYIVQLSTRQGFDEFLLRLRSCGLRYRLQRMPAVLPSPLLDELQRRMSTLPVVGGPVGAGTPTNTTTEEGFLRTERRSGFEEFVLCSVCRSSSWDEPDQPSSDILYTATAV